MSGLLGESLIFFGVFDFNGVLESSRIRAGRGERSFLNRIFSFDDFNAS
jgi:hypothetical protein